jgi:Tfp pilus assembly protein PilF
MPEQDDPLDASFNDAIDRWMAGDLPAAEAILRGILRSDPTRPNVLHTLGCVLFDKRDFGSAALFLRKAVELRPKWTEALMKLGRALLENGKPVEAEAAFSAAWSTEPSAQVLIELSRCFQAVNRWDEADKCLRQVLQSEPKHSHGLLERFRFLCDSDRIAESADCLRVIGRGRRDNLLWELRADLQCPTVFSSAEEIDEYRARLAQKLEMWRDRRIRAPFAQFVQTGIRPPFNLPFHGRDERPVRELLASIFAPGFEQPARPAGMSGRHDIDTARAHVGFVVTEGHERAFLRSLGGAFNHFEFRGFAVTIVCAHGATAKIREVVLSPRIRLLELPRKVTYVPNVIHAERFSAVYYWEVGSDSLNYFLPFMRLAPLHVTSWGIQVTTGIPRMDLYASSVQIEPPDADQHYSEVLVRLGTLPSYQFPMIPPVKLRDRDWFGLSKDQHVYLCPQQIGKFHPEFDGILRDILRTDPAGVIVITQGRSPPLRQKLEQRFRGTLAEVADRVRFVPQQSGDDYTSLLRIADVLLDPIHFGGVNTTYDAFSLGKAVVTLPSAYQRGRYTLGCYRVMDILDCVAESPQDYVGRAVRIATDRDCREWLEGRIRSASGVLFENHNVARDLEDWLVREIDAMKYGTG